MTAKRFVKFNLTANDDCTILNGVKDTVTGEWYHTIDNENAKRLCGLLNELAEENQKLQNELETYKSGNVVLKKTLDKYEKVMRKYELDSVEKLDQVLREQRVW